MLNHFVSQKREEMEVLSPQEISTWYFSDSDDEDVSDSDDEDIYEKTCNFNALLLYTPIHKNLFTNFTNRNHSKFIRLILYLISFQINFDY